MIGGERRATVHNDTSAQKAQHSTESEKHFMATMQESVGIQHNITAQQIHHIEHNEEHEGMM